MNKLMTTLCSAALLSASASAFAMDHMKMDHMKNDCMAMQMKTMDANGDGMISKSEYMNHQTMQWEKMSKNKSGMVSVKDMEMMHKDMHKDCMDKDAKMDSMEK